jgi:hypothetical protein
MLSATAKASLSSNHDDLTDLEQRIETLLVNHSEPAVFSKSKVSNIINAAPLKSFEDVGSFVYELSSSRYVFISSESRRMYYVKFNKDIKDKISSDQIYNITGLNFSNETESELRPPSEQTSFNFLNPDNFIFVTGVDIQS